MNGQILDYCPICLGLNFVWRTGARGQLIFLTHSIRVKACVLLVEAGRDGWYIKLRLRWMSECYNIYLCNTQLITAQHSDAMSACHLSTTTRCTCWTMKIKM